jgi:phosphoglycolate phosphatase-like HAD superfamily hydrolase
MTMPVLRALGVERRFGVVVAGGDAPMKPDPEPIVLAMAALGAQPRETWLVGDGTQDVRGGKAAGCRTAAVMGGFHPEERLRAESPDVVLPTLFEIDALLDAAP